MNTQELTNTPAMVPSILEVKNLHIHYPIAAGTVRAVEDVSFSLGDGEVLGIVGESGCGKSTLGLSILRLLRSPGRTAGGQILYRNTDILGMDQKALMELRGRRIAMIFQNPLTSLNPVFTIQRHFTETLKVHEPNITKEAAQERILVILKALNIEPKRLREYPHQLSGGMRQRIMIGLGLILNPDIVIADEPTTALDVIVEAGFIELLKKLKKEFKLSVMLVSHNLGLVAEMADRIMVMYGGKVMECGSAEAVFNTPLHPYTRGLMASIPNIELDSQELPIMPGNPPDLVSPPAGCRFAPRCIHALPVCHQNLPPLHQFGSHAEPSLTSLKSHEAACWLYEPASSGGLGLKPGDILPPGTAVNPDIQKELQP